MTNDMDLLKSLTPSQVEDLARIALDAKAKAKERSQKQRDKKREAGLVPISAYVPAARAEYIRHIVNRAVAMSEQEFAARSAKRS